MRKKTNRTSRHEERKRKWDFDQLKKEFWTSDMDDVKTYFQARYKIYNSHIAKSTIGWSKEKLAWKRKVAEQFINDLATEEVAQYKSALSNVMAGFKMKIATKEDIKGLSTKQLMMLWQVFMTMCGKPTRIQKQQFDSDHPLKVDLSDEAKKRLSKYTDGKSKP